jgi:hypothetical protein
MCKTTDPVVPPIDCSSLTENKNSEGCVIDCEMTPDHEDCFKQEVDCSVKDN